MTPAATNPNVKSVVATGRRMNGLESDMRERDPRPPYTLAGEAAKGRDLRAARR